MMIMRIISGRGELGETSCHLDSSDDNYEVSIAMSKSIVLIIAHEGYYENELYIPLEVFRDRGYETYVASTRTGIATGMMGGCHQPDGALPHVEIDDKDAIVLIGGQGASEHLWENEELHHLLQRSVAERKLVAAICGSPVALVRAGILTGQKATVYPELADELRKENVEFIDAPVVISGRFVTGRDAASSRDYAETICGLLEG